MEHSHIDIIRLPLLRRARHEHTVAHLGQLPPDLGREVAIAGRSNAGKSSTINMLAGHKGLARVSRSPGRTQQLIFFALDGERRLVDLPGYGYAKVPEAMRRGWAALVEGYLRRRRCLRGVVLIMDIRHPLGSQDRMLLDFCLARQLPVHVLLNKADKLGRGNALHALRELRGQWPKGVSAQLFSATTGLGLAEAQALLAGWLGIDDEKKAPESSGAKYESYKGGEDSLSGQGGRGQTETTVRSSVALD